MTDKLYDVAVIGGGSAGMSAALYLKRSGLDVVLIERGLYGGQLNNTSSIENYIGVGNIGGAELSEQMYSQIIENDIDTMYGDVKNIEFDIDKTTILQMRKRSVKSKTVILATGVKHKELGVTGEKENQGRGISYCATCDGYFFKDKDVAVIGGGDSALEEGAFLADLANTVTLVYRKGKEDLRAKESLQERFFSKPNTKMIEWANTSEIHSDGSNLKALSYEHKYILHDNDGEHAYIDQKSINVDGVFIYVGVEPINDLAKQIGVELDSNGYIKVGTCYQTSTPGVFAIGDIIHTDMKQVAIAVSDGALVSKYVKEYIDSM